MKKILAASQVTGPGRTDRDRGSLPLRLEDCLTERLSMVHLAGEKISLVDCDDYDWLSQWSWHAHRVRKTNKWYARRSVTANGRRHYITMHRAILERHGFDLTELAVDHVNGNGLDNRLANIRPVSRAQNAYNRRKSPGHTSSYKGVYFDSQRGKWRASIKVNGQTIQLGRYLTEEEAALVYNDAARMYFGEFARLNEQLQVEVGRERECIKLRPFNIAIGEASQNACL